MIRYVFISLFFLLSSSNLFAKSELMISAGFGVKDVLTELGSKYEERNKIKLSFNFAASGQHKAQIEQGAPVDIFMSAAMADMDDLEAKGLIIKDSKAIIARNKIVLIVPQVSKNKITVIDDLKAKEIAKIAIGNPDTVPAGRYAKESLKFYNVFEELKSKMVLGENVRQVLDYVARNEVDAGLVYVSDARIEPKVKIALELPANSHKPIVFPIAIIKSSKNQELCKDFIKYLISAESQAVFAKYGFSEK